MKKKEKKEKITVKRSKRWIIALVVCIVAMVLGYGGKQIFCFLYSGSMPCRVMEAMNFFTPVTDRSNLLTTHFLSALAEISTTIPRMEEVTLATDKHSQYTMRRRQVDMIENLAFTSTLVGNTELARQVLTIKYLMYDIHRKTSDSEDAFKDAVAMIDATTVSILKELPILNLHLQEGRICTSLLHLASIIQSVSTLIDQLEASTVPVATLRVDVTKLVSDIGILESNLHYMNHKTSIGLVSHDRASEEYRTASWFTTMSRPDQQKYENLVLLHKNIGDMQLSTKFLDQTFERSEVQINVAMNHLKSTKRKLLDIYTELGRSSNQIEDYKLRMEEMNQFKDICDEEIRFGSAEMQKLRQLGEETIAKIEQVRRQNEPVLTAISIHGYGAIQA